MGFPSGSVDKESACNAGEAEGTGLIPESGRSPGRGHGNPLQYSCLESPMDRGACWVMVHGVPKSANPLNGNPFQYSCLENPMDRGACWVMVHGVPKSANPLHLPSSPHQGCVRLQCSGPNSAHNSPPLLPRCQWLTGRFSIFVLNSEPGAQG